MNQNYTSALFTETFTPRYLKDVYDRTTTRIGQG